MLSIYFYQIFVVFLLVIIGFKGGHMFKEQTFTNMQWCDMCGSCLWGLHHQGVMCSECGYQCHRKCTFDTVVVCPRRRVRVRRESDADGKIRSHIRLLNWFMCQYWIETGRQTDRQTYRQPLFQALLMFFPHFDAIHTTLKKFETMKFKVAFTVSSVIQCKSYMV